MLKEPLLEPKDDAAAAAAAAVATRLKEQQSRALGRLPGTRTKNGEKKSCGVLGTSAADGEEKLRRGLGRSSPSDLEDQPGRSHRAPPPQLPPLCARSLPDVASNLAASLRDTELAAAAKAFAGKTRKFARKSGRSERLSLVLAGRNLARLAKDSRYAREVSDVLLGAESVLEEKRSYLDAILQFFGLGNKERLVPDPHATPGSDASENPATSSWLQRFRLAISPAQPLLPIQEAAEDSLVGKRQIIYAVAIATPVSLLTSAAGLKLFPGAWAWVAGAGVAVWIVTCGGMVLNQYGILDWERFAAQHLGRLGMLGSAILFSFYVYRAYFPSDLWGLFLLIVVSILSIGGPWFMSFVRGDEHLKARVRGLAKTAQQLSLRFRWIISVARGEETT